MAKTKNSTEKVSKSTAAKKGSSVKANKADAPVVSKASAIKGKADKKQSSAITKKSNAQTASSTSAIKAKSDKNANPVFAEKTASKTSKIKAKAGAAKDLQDLFEDGLKDIYWAEKALIKSLPKMEKNASSPELKKAINKHLTETSDHIKRLEEAFKSIGKKAEAEKCDAMAGLLDEAKGIMEETAIGHVRDAGIIAAAQKVEHYEIATYGTLAAFAKVLGHKSCLKLLLKTLDEEKNCDKALSDLADTNLNSKAK